MLYIVFIDINVYYYHGYYIYRVDKKLITHTKILNLIGKGRIASEGRYIVHT